jgi:hypothetical protein
MSKTTKAKTVNDEIARIEKLDSEGLLEAYVLLALADDGIARDYTGYLKTNRAKLRAYVQKYVIRSGS